MKMFAVAGNPIFHSRSPDMFNAAFKFLSIEACYFSFAAFSSHEIMDVTKQVGLSGLNITSPFKENMVPLIDIPDENVKRLKALNTIVLSDGISKAYNTDIYGVKCAFEQNGIDLKGKKIAVFGAGGAARAVLSVLGGVGAQVTIFNRTLQKAQEFSREFQCKAQSLEETEITRQMDIIIFCLPVQEALVSVSYLREGQIILDANYGKAHPLLSEAKKRGVRIIDGREWLLFQAKEAFGYFTSIEAPLGIMRRAVYEEKKKKGIISLTGFMGAGKTEVGRILARKLNLPFLDIDEIIEKRTGKEIKSIFIEEGEEAFRKLEREEIEKIRLMKEAVVAVGGGAVLSEENRRILRECSHVVWLWAKKETILKRLANENKRPLLEGNKERIIEDLLPRRIPFYAQTAHMLISTNEWEPEIIAERIKTEITHGT